MDQKVQILGDGTFKGTQLLINGVQIKRITEFNLNLKDGVQEITITISNPFKTEFEINLVSEKEEE